MNIFVFDIETVPDTESAKTLYDLHDLNDKEIAEVMFARCRQATGGSEFLRHHLHKIVAISAVLRTQNELKVWSLGDVNSSEHDLVQRFFAGIERYTPNLVSWNGSGFDLPVLHYRALLHGVVAPCYWETGKKDFKWNNYISRFHDRHTDLMDVLSGYTPRAFAPLADIAGMLGLPGKMGMDGSKVWDYYLDGKIDAIRNYCETDVLNTYLIYVRYELMRGQLSESKYKAACDQVIEMLEKKTKPHYLEFLNAWRAKEAHSDVDTPSDDER